MHEPAVSGTSVPRVDGLAKVTGRAVFGDMGQGLSPYPYALIYPQDEHERLLIDRLAAVGVDVERRIELMGFEEASGRAVTHLKHADGTQETCAAAYIAGCDGTHSRVREALGIGFPGGIYAHLFYVADVEATSAELRSRGVRLLYDTPRRGTADSRINFVHPKDAGGVLIELVQPAPTPL